MAAVVQQTSAGNLLALLDEDDDALRLYALQNLNTVVHDFWFQIASSIASVEAFYEDEDFSHREIAALLASKVFYHLGELDDALTYALGAGKLFDINENSEFVNTIIARCMDKYVELQHKAAEDSEAVSMDARLVAVVERMFERCYRDGQYAQAIGIALEALRLDVVEEAVRRSPDRAATLAYLLRACQDLVANRGFRFQVLRLLIQLYEGVPAPDWVSICQCHMFLGDSPAVAAILHRLLQGSEDDALLAFQVGFDLFENEEHSFLLKVSEELQRLAPASPRPAPRGATPAPASGAPPPGVLPPTANGDAAPCTADAAIERADEATPLLARPQGEAMETDGAQAGAVGAPQGLDELDGGPVVSLEGVRYRARHVKLEGILTGVAPIGLHLEFLYSHNHADLQVVKNIKNAVEVRNSVCHSAVIFANAMMHAGTTVDAFLRENLDWLSRATNWAKFSATAGLGVIHAGHLAQGRALMAPYLPRDGASSSPYSEGGALFALGLIHAHHGRGIREFLLSSLRATSSEVTQHGACLGLGLAGLGSCDEEVLEELKGVLYTDSAVAGEAAGLALGMLCAGSATDKAAELLTYAHDTQHEKIIRGLALGLALIMYGREEGAETLIEQMTRDQDPIIRYGGMYVVGMAYRGTANNAATARLLHFAVSDVSDDVRRAAVLCLGFVLLAQPDQCPRIVALLAQSYNPHVRYGAAMAVGLACAGSGLRAATDLLEPLLTDAVDFVRQGALIAAALVLMQQPEARVAPLRARLERVVGDKHEEVMARMGAVMAAGLLDAGGRNAVPGLRSSSGFFRRTAVVGLAVFTQYWYWYPLAYTAALALQPAALIALDADLRQPRLQVVSRCRPSLYAYPGPASAEAATTRSTVPVAVLSTTARARERAQRKAAHKAAPRSAVIAAAPATDSTPGPPAPSTGAAAMEARDKGPAAGAEAAGAAAPGAEAAAKPPKPEPEPRSYTLENPARILPAQQKVVSFVEGSRWVPIQRSHPPAGIIVMRDTRPGEPVDLVDSAAPHTGAAQAPPPAAAATTAPAAAPASAQQEPPPPEPFEYLPH